MRTVQKNPSNISINQFQNTLPGQFATGGQPGAGQIEELASAGYQVVVNLSPESTKNFLPEEECLVRESGLDYHHLPIDCSTLYPEQYAAFRDLLNQIKTAGKGPVFLHCGMNIKSSGFFLLYRVLEMGHDPAVARRDLEELGLHDQKWADYFKQMLPKD